MQLAGVPRAALAFHWAEFGRQVRVRGAVTPDTPERSAADFLARGATARAETRHDLASGAWDERFGHLRNRQSTYEGSLVAIRATPEE
ncbi:hypothetical protein [Streptomyces narbonensis]|uniref:hypothetical protein n=1 Tax=Streptomyces narbonensis TaxID=67333 RepID=UPI003F4D6BDE